MINAASIHAIAGSDDAGGTFFIPYFLGEPVTPNTWGAMIQERGDIIIMLHLRTTFVTVTRAQLDVCAVYGLFVCLFVLPST